MTFRDQLINQHVQEGASVRDVAQEFGTTTGAVALVVFKCGGSFPEAEWRNRKIVQRYRDGASKAQIARDLGVSQSLVHHEIQRARNARRQGAHS